MLLKGNDCQSRIKINVIIAFLDRKLFTISLFNSNINSGIFGVLGKSRLMT